MRVVDIHSRRCAFVTTTPTGRDLIVASRPLLRETFAARFSALEDWERHLLLSWVRRVAESMDAEQIDAAPFLWTRQPTGPPLRRSAGHSRRFPAAPDLGYAAFIRRSCVSCRSSRIRQALRGTAKQRPAQAPRYAKSCNSGRLIDRCPVRTRFHPAYSRSHPCR